MEGFKGFSVEGVENNLSPFKAYFAYGFNKGRLTGSNILREYEDVLQSWGLQKKECR